MGGRQSLCQRLHFLQGQRLHDLIKQPGASKRSVVVPEEILEYLNSGGNQTFRFPWGDVGVSVDNRFWHALLGLGTAYRGMLRDEVCNYSKNVKYMNPPSSLICPSI